MTKSLTKPTCFTCELLPYNKDIGVLEIVPGFLGYRCTVNRNHVFNQLDLKAYQTDNFINLKFRGELIGLVKKEYSDLIIDAFVQNYEHK